MAKVSNRVGDVSKKPAAKRATKKSVQVLADTGADDNSTSKTAASKPQKTSSKTARPKKSRSAVLQLAQDILEDRILPTIEQIKSVAASAIGQTKPKKSKSKAKKKK